MPDGVHFKYNYFIKQDSGAYCDIIWRLGPEFSLSVPLSKQPNEKIMVKDLWMSSKTEIPPVFSWGMWLEVIDYPEPMEHGQHQSLSPGNIQHISFILKFLASPL